MENKIAGNLDMEKYQQKTCTYSQIKNPNNPDPHIHTEV